MKPWMRFLHKFFPFRRKPTQHIDFKDISDEEEAAWWGRFQMDTDQSRFLKIWARVLCTDRYQQDWRIAFSQEKTLALGYILSTQSKDT